MRKLIIVRGPQASGKSTLVRNLGLEDFKISGDDIRKVRTGLVLNTQGEFITDQEDGYTIWQIAREYLKIRFGRGEFVVLEGTFPNPADYDDIIDEAISNRYKVALVDMTGLSQGILIDRDAERPVKNRVRASTIQKYHDRYVPHDVGDKRIDDFFCQNTVSSPLERWVQHDIVDLNRYEQIIHIGDLQGVYEAAFKEGSPLTEKLDPKSFYIFVGDALDRGLENDKVLGWIISDVVPCLGKNAVWIAGNHERHLRDMVEGNDIVSKEFENRTLPQLMKLNCSMTHVREFLDKMEDMFIYRHAGENVVVTHAGLLCVPENPSLVPAYQAMLGVSGFGENVDENFSAWAQNQDIVWRQVHGHRNKNMFPTRVNEHSFNLEGQAEMGGHIRIAVKTKANWETFDMRNDIYRDPREWRDINKEENRKPHGAVLPIPSWIEKGQTEGYLSEETLTEFKEHDHVNIRTQDSRPYIDTIAFGKTAFYSKTWDGITNKARGLFVDNRNRRIVARSWNKFFNLGERPEVELDLIASTWTYPMSMSLKDNGFLGLASWDHERNELVLSSKGSMDGDFAELFREVANEVLGVAGIEKLGRAVRDLNGTAAFEVIHPEKDPHIVEYDGPNLVLLDFIQNDEKFNKLDYKKLVKLAAYVGVKPRIVMAMIPNEQALRSMVEKLGNPNSGLYKKHIEGVVIEDAEGRFVKIKSGWYAKWKYARGTVEKLAIQRRRGQEVDLNISEEIEEFMHWVMAQDDAVTDLPIITLRKLFLERRADAPVFDREAMARQKQIEETKAKEAKEIDGFMRGYEAIIKRIKTKEASVESVRKLIARASESDHIKNEITKRDDYSEVLSYAENTQGEGA